MPRPAISPLTKQLNAELGNRVRVRREELGLTPGPLEDTLLLAPGALSRIEAGDKGLDAGLLVALTQALDVPISFFFDDLAPELRPQKSPTQPPEMVDELTAFLVEFHAIEDEAERQRILALLRSVAESDKY